MMIAPSLLRRRSGVCARRFFAAGGCRRRSIRSSSRPLVVLGIETSCDDTGVAVVRSDGVVLGEALAGQGDIHEQWGGIMPALARDSHQRVIDRVISDALADAGLSLSELDAVAVTQGPGLEMCLRVGTEAAARVADEARVPLVAVNHLEAHCLMARLTEPTLEFPFLTLLVSGGHCQIVLCRGLGDHQVLGSTLDDAVGEAFDKAARMLGLPAGGGGGPHVEALAARGGDPAAYPFTVPMRHRPGSDFSYSGLKNGLRLAILEEVAKANAAAGGSAEGGGGEEEAASAGKVAKEVEEEGGGGGATRDFGIGRGLAESVKADLAASFQHVAVTHLEERLRRAMVVAEDLLSASSVAAAGPPEEGGSGSGSGAGTGAREAEAQRYTLVASGGVAANRMLRGRLESLCRGLASETEDKRGKAARQKHQKLRRVEEEQDEEEQVAAGGEAAAGVAGVPAARERREVSWSLACPPARLCTDNGVMVAWAGVEQLERGVRVVEQASDDAANSADDDDDDDGGDDEGTPSPAAADAAADTSPPRSLSPRPRWPLHLLSSVPR